MVPRIEPDRAEPASLEIATEELHERALPGAPWSGDRDGERWFRARVANEARQSGRDLSEIEDIAISLTQGAITYENVGDRLLDFLFFRCCRRDVANVAPTVRSANA